MAKRDEIVSFCNDFLKLHDYPDYGPMGLQWEGVEDVKRIGLAVSASRDVFLRAEREGCQLVIVHHGMFWNTESRVLDPRTIGRFEALNGGRLTLLAYHLALDAHPEIGNNVNAAHSLGVANKDIVPFAGIGAGGKLFAPQTLAQIRKTAFHTFGTTPTLFRGHDRPVERLAAITGSAGSYIVQAAKEGYDLFVTGEAEEPSIYLARELGINFMACGHHATEKSGLIRLGAQIQKEFGVTNTFIDVGNPV
jgi:dinuclear metal center YbgI/SA1388 family protein